jgi:recombination protein RecT
MTKTQALEKTKGDTIRLLDNPVVKRQIQLAIPKHLTVDRLLRTTMTAIRMNPKLLECTQKSLLAAVIGCAQLGLEPEPFLGQAYLVPFKKKVGDSFIVEATLIPGYRGYIALARRSGEVQTVSSHVVYEKDHFEFQFGLDEKLVHIPYQPKDENDTAGDPIGAYVVFKYKDGSHSMDYMTNGEIMRIAKRSKTYDAKKEIWTGPWETDLGEMMKKTVIRRHVKLAPLSIEIQKAAHYEEKAMLGEGQFETTFPELPETTETKTFEELTHGKDITALDDFIAEISKANDSTPEKVKEDACKDFDNFWAVFEKWKKRKPAPKEAKKKEPEIKSEVKEDPLSGDCPDTGEKYKQSYCKENCKGFGDCPAWEPQTNQE